MQRGIVLTSLSTVIALALGLVLGAHLPHQAAPPSDSGDTAMPSPSVFADSTAPAPPANSVSVASQPDNFSLLYAACAVAQSIREQDYAALASYVHPQQGVTFMPYSTVHPQEDLTFTAGQIRDLANDETVYTWGFADGKGAPIQMTLEEYFAAYVFSTDYTQAPHLGIDQIIMNGNALENLAEAYPDCHFVDFCFPSLNSVNQGQDWCSLKVVFQTYQDTWKLVALVHGQWTI